MRLSLAAYGRVVFFAPPPAARQLRKLAGAEPYVNVVEFNHDSYRPEALQLPPLDQIIPQFRTRTGEPEPCDDPPAFETDRFGHAPIPAESGALPNRPPDQLPKTERPFSNAPRLRLRGDDPEPWPAPQRRRNWRF